MVKLFKIENKNTGLGTYDAANWENQGEETSTLTWTPHTSFPLQRKIIVVMFIVIIFSTFSFLGKLEFLSHGIKSTNQLNNNALFQNKTFWSAITNDLSFNTNSSTTIRIINFHPQKYYSVLASIINTTVTFAPQQISKTLLPGGTLALDYKLYFPMPGIYSIIIHEFETSKTKEGPRVKPHEESLLLSSENVFISVENAQHDNAYELMKSKIQHLLPCQTVVPEGLTDWSGNWYGPGTTLTPLGGKMRTGWTYFPKKCTLEVFNRTDFNLVQLSSNSQKYTISILGTSKERGVFLSLVDLILPSSQKMKMKSSVMSKCWGHMRIEIGNIKFVYQDIRSDYLDPEKDFIMCHNDNLAKLPGMWQNATKMIRNMFEEDMPTVLLLNSGCGDAIYNDSLFRAKAMKCTNFVKGLISQIPQTWRGTIYTVDSFSFSATITQMMTEKGYLDYTRNLKKWSKLVNDTRVRMLDTVSLGNPMGLTAEHPGQLHTSVHWHHFCDQEDIKVCSNVTDTVSQLLLGRALAPKGKKSFYRTHTSEDFLNATHLSQDKFPIPVVCSDCPLNLLPFHIKPAPELSCTTGPLNNDPRFFTAIGHFKCPTECMIKNDITGYRGTESNIVVERTCTVGNNPTTRNEGGS